jgi:hypothetical protein
VPAGRRYPPVQALARARLWQPAERQHDDTSVENVRGKKHLELMHF